MLTQWKYTVDPTSDTPCILINSHIGPSADLSENYIDGADFEKEISTLDGMGKKSIDIYINSGGGRVDHGYSIFNSIYRCKTPTTTYAIGLANSIAGVIFQAGAKRIMYSNAILMVHNPAFDNDDDSSEENSVLNTFKKTLLEMLSFKSKLSMEEIDKLMDKETWMLADEAKKYGFCDGIIELGGEKTVINFTDDYDKIIILFVL